MRRLIHDPYQQVPGGAAGGTGLHSTIARTDVGGDWPGEGTDMPQMGGAFKLLMPAQDDFRLPANLAQLFTLKPFEDTNPRSKTKGQQIERLVLTFDRANPLVIASGPRMGDVLTKTLSSNPRARGKKDNPSTMWISDLVLLLDTSLADKSRPGGETPQAANQALMNALIKHAGKVVRLDHGLQGSCNPNNVVRLAYQDPTDANKVVVAEDPQGRKGCGKRYYTSAFKNPAPTTLDDLYLSEINCEGTVPNPADPTQTTECLAVVRAFPEIERFLPPLGTK